jgi:hydrogenase nickel incorporation protein HypA/HybF
MHEIAYALELLERIEKTVRDAGGAKVVRVKVRLGMQRGIRPKSLRTAFDWAKLDTIAEGTELDIEVIPTSLHCTLCDQMYVTNEALDECPNCGALGGEVLSGNEFSIDRVEIEGASALIH